MSGAVIAANVSIKIMAAVSASRTTAGVLYTAPANSYAIVQLGFGSASSGAIFPITIDGREVTTGRRTTGEAFFAGQNDNTTATTSFSSSGSLYVGPNQVLAVGAITGTGTITATGVEFTNSP